MKGRTQVILLTISVCIVAGYLLFACCFAPHRHKHEQCTALSICIKDSNERQFVEEDDLRRLIQQKQLDPTGKARHEVSTDEIERTVAAHPLLKSTEVYKSKNGQVCVDVRQRTPRLRVMGEENYFVDTDRKIMPAGSTTASYVPILTGRVTKKRATGDLYDFVQFLEDNEFWNAQIVQIHITPTQQIELIPRVGDQVILLGELTGYEQKLDKLHTFYTAALNKRGWLPYKEIDLRYHGQIIGRR